MIRIFILTFFSIIILVCQRGIETCKLQKENCTCQEYAISVIQINCFENQLNSPIDLDLGQLMIEKTNKFVILMIKNKFINQIKTFENKYSNMIKILIIVDCLMEKLRSDSLKAGVPNLGSADPFGSAA